MGFGTRWLRDCGMASHAGPKSALKGESGRLCASSSASTLESLPGSSCSHASRTNRDRRAKLYSLRPEAQSLALSNAAPIPTAGFHTFALERRAFARHMDLESCPAQGKFSVERVRRRLGPGSV